MEDITQILVLAGATAIATGLSFGMAWAFLHGAFRLMQPAAAQTARQPRKVVRFELVQGTRAAARGFGRG